MNAFSMSGLIKCYDSFYILWIQNSHTHIYLYICEMKGKPQVIDLKCVLYELSDTLYNYLIINLYILNMSVYS